MIHTLNKQFDNFLIRRARLVDAKVMKEIADQHRIIGALDKLDKQTRLLSEEGFLFADLTVQQYENYIKTEPAIYVAYADDQVVGFVMGTYAKSNKYENLFKAKIYWQNKIIKSYYEADRYLYLWMIGVKKAYQNRRIGKCLIEVSKLRSKELGLLVLIGDFMKEPVKNLKSEFFFRSQNFLPCGILNIADYYGSGNSKWEIIYY